ncbi:Cof subfamily of IIB subfamily of haloacid dehalogenase superfamily/HAD-superfamily hydrolase, subfamily IIB [Curtobacterium sp. UNCCL20]|uniref:HAD family hydrolase n=1 Tax=Curtobacterium sp. UNCCL20 TaxID=1502773 RepID=UPI00088B0573|nr:HAD-IIB family hydrolase [Curtobacterium sp. UNCCL20]SDQ62048.1 Cof subfamily of IIB subfamily of haloacid dehalogenase superfamily/HAD-superfamily hydrolase, subfamily IIB [Curtobacterium sp. UNCCL20]
MSTKERFVDGPTGGAGGPVRTKRWLVALDIDGTTMREDGVVTETVIAALRDAEAAGHEVMLSTGRSEGMTVPLLARLGIRPKYLVCANGALTLARRGDGSYERVHVETFNPSEVLQTVHGALAQAAFGVEDETGHFLLSANFPDDAMTTAGEHVAFDRLLDVEATRVVVISPEHGLEEFLQIVEDMGLHKVSYTVGWTAWLDIAPEGVTKATAMERVREWLDIPRSRVFAAGDGRNDIDMLRWASTSGRGIVMGQAPEDVIDAGNELTGGVDDDGLAAALDSLPR